MINHDEPIGGSTGLDHGSTASISEAALWLASPGGAFVTGQCIVVDGGTLVSDGG